MKKLVFAAFMLLAFAVSCDKNEVREQKDPVVESISVVPSSIELTVGDEYQLTVEYSPEDAVDKTAVWSCSPSGVVEVDQEGKVVALAPGEAVVTAACGEIEATCSVVVKEVAVETVELDKESAEISVGETVQLSATVLPADAADLTVSWSSSDQDVASVDDAGLVYGLSAGEAEITAEAGGVKAVCSITVKEVPVSSIELDPTEKEIEVGQSFTISATVKPANAGDKTVVWSSEDESIAKVDLNGTVTGISEGTVAILAQAGDVKAECSVRVNPAPVPVESVRLNETSLELKLGESFTLIAEVLPEDADDKTVTWISSADGIARVSDGVVTALAEGEAVITASAGGKTAECNVTVVAGGSEEPVADIKSDWSVGEFFDVEEYGKGVVFEAGDNYIKVVSFVENTYKSFSPYGVEPMFTDLELVDGKPVADALAGAGVLSDYPAADWARSKGEFWYLPTIKELTELYSQSSAVNSGLVSNGSATLPMMVWSCIESDTNVNQAYAYVNGSGKYSYNRAQTCNVIAVMKLRFK